MAWVIPVISVWGNGHTSLVPYGSSVSFGIVQIHHPQLREGGAAATGVLLVY